MSTGKSPRRRTHARSARPRPKSAGKPSRGPSLEEQLADLQRWHRWRYSSPQSTGLSRIQQWVSAYAEGVLKPKSDEPPGPAGVIAN
jgi:hypothetical protein